MLKLSYVTTCAAVCISLSHCLGESLSLDYQNIYSNHDDIELGVRYDGACSHFVVETFTRKDIVDGGSSVQGEYISTVGSSAVNVSQEVFNQTEPVYVRIVAASEDGTICSDGQSQQSFYRFVAAGIEEIEYEPFSTVEIPIPTTHCDHPIFLWPGSNGGQCYCLSLHNDLYSFEACAEECQTHHNVTRTDSSIFFHDLNMTSFLVHFVCDEDPCFQSSCILETVVASYQIIKRPDPSPNNCEEAGHTNGCCTGECSVLRENMRQCYCDVSCHANDICCDDILEIGCYPRNCTEAGKLNCILGVEERCNVEIAPNKNCYCDERCGREDICCDDATTGSTGFLLSSSIFVFIMVVITIMAIFICIMVPIVLSIPVANYRRDQRRKESEAAAAATAADNSSRAMEY